MVEDISPPQQSDKRLDEYLVMDINLPQQGDKIIDKCFLKDISHSQQSGEKQNPESGQEVWLQKRTIPLMLTKLIFDI